MVESVTFIEPGEETDCASTSSHNPIRGANTIRKKSVDNFNHLKVLILFLINRNDVLRTLRTVSYPGSNNSLLRDGELLATTTDPLAPFFEVVRFRWVLGVICWSMKPVKLLL